MRNQNRIWFILIIVFGLLFIIIGSTDTSDIIQRILQSVVTVVGVIAVWYQLKKEKDISEAEFILNLNNTFVQDEGIKYIYNLLRANVNNEDTKYLDDKDRKFVVDYLTFFETLYILFSKGIFKINEINEMFAYRFFIAVNNIEVRRLELNDNGMFFKALYDLYVPWAEYRRKYDMEIINEHLDFEKYFQKNHIPKLVKVKDEYDYTIKFYNLLTEKDVWQKVDEILVECNDEFLPPLSTRGFHGKILPVEKQNPENFAYMKELRKQSIITIEVHNEIVGFVSFYHQYPDDEFETIGRSNYIMTVCVKTEYRRKGYAHIMYNFLVNNLPKEYRMKHVSTRTWSTNESHIQLLKKMGFKTDHVVKNARDNEIDTIYYYIEQ